jgi:hypothetical protein
VLLFSVVPDEAPDQLTIDLIGSDKQLLGSAGFVLFGFSAFGNLFLFNSSDRVTMFDGRLCILSGARRVPQFSVADLLVDSQIAAPQIDTVPSRPTVTIKVAIIGEPANPPSRYPYR